MVAALVDDLVAHLTPVAERITDRFPLDQRAVLLMDQLSELTLGPVQHLVRRRVQERLARSDEGGPAHTGRA